MIFPLIAVLAVIIIVAIYFIKNNKKEDVGNVPNND